MEVKALSIRNEMECMYIVPYVKQIPENRRNLIYVFS